ncbi:unnamed protein product [Victoria cruziana]
MRRLCLLFSRFFLTTTPNLGVARDATSTIAAFPFPFSSYSPSSSSFSYFSPFPLSLSRSVEVWWCGYISEM